MPDGFALTPEQKKTFEDLVKGAGPLNTEVKGAGKKFDAFSALLGSERVLTEIKSRLPLDFNGRALVECDASNTKEVVASLAKFVSQSSRIPVLALLNYNYRSILETLGNPSEGVVIIDTVSKGISHVEEGENLLFVDSPRNLTQLEIKILNLAKENPKITLIFDSLGVLYLYHDAEVVTKFIYSITKLLHKKGVPAFFVSASKTPFAAAQFFEETVKLKKFL